MARSNEISLQTEIKLKELKKGYKIKICEPDRLINLTKRFKPNIIFNALHGQYGEDGCG